MEPEQILPVTCKVRSSSLLCGSRKLVCTLPARLKRSIPCSDLKLEVLKASYQSVHIQIHMHIWIRIHICIYIYIYVYTHIHIRLVSNMQARIS